MQINPEKWKPGVSFKEFMLGKHVAEAVSGVSDFELISMFGHTPCCCILQHPETRKLYATTSRHPKTLYEIHKRGLDGYFASETTLPGNYIKKLVVLRPERNDYYNINDIVVLIGEVDNWPNRAYPLSIFNKYDIWRMAEEEKKVAYTVRLEHGFCNSYASLIDYSKWKKGQSLKDFLEFWYDNEILTMTFAISQGERFLAVDKVDGTLYVVEPTLSKTRYMRVPYPEGFYESNIEFPTAVDSSRLLVVRPERLSYDELKKYKGPAIATHSKGIYPSRLVNLPISEGEKLPSVYIYYKLDRRGY